jgi:hypothetical protein
MKFSSPRISVPLVRLFCGLFVLALAQGCVWVDIGKDSCGKSKTNEQGERDPTGCISEPWPGSAVGFKDVATGQPVPPGSPLMCTGPNSRRCKPTNPGNCGFGPPCVTKYYSNTDRSCKCECS